MALAAASTHQRYVSEYAVAVVSPVNHTESCASCQEPQPASGVLLAASSVSTAGMGVYAARFGAFVFAPLAAGMAA